jgi:hypothetical protein
MGKPQATRGTWGTPAFFEELLVALAGGGPAMSRNGTRA